MKNATERLRSARVSDRVSEIETMLKTLKNEEYKLLTDFMFLSVDDLDVYMDVTDEGGYVLTVKAVSDKLIDIGKLID